MTVSERRSFEDSRFAGDPHRPQYHFLPPANWMNDPNGLIQWDGEVHFFYQHNPDRPYWGAMHWGHAVSDDLVHWRDLPIALAPTPDSPDAGGCWSGYAVNDRGTPTLIYTGWLPDGTQRPCLATSKDGLLTWQKYPGNPIIDGPPPDLDTSGFRDHSVWREGKTWYQVIGSGVKEVGGAVLLYRSPDLRQWEYLGPALIGEKESTGTMWECPDLFPLGERHVLVVSPIPLRRSLYFVGSYRDNQFRPEVQEVVDYGGHFYAPLSMCDDSGRRLMFGWLWEGRSQEAFEVAGWAGVASLPRHLTLRRDGYLSQVPVAELAALRGDHFQLKGLELSPDSANPLADVRGDALEILARFEAASNSSLADAGFGLSLRCSPDGDEATHLVYDGPSGRLFVDRAQASVDPETQGDEFGGPLPLTAHEPLTLHIYLDHSVVEVFGNYRTCLASRIYPARDDSLGLDLFVRQGRVWLRSLDVWTMGSIW